MPAALEGTRARAFPLPRTEGVPGTTEGDEDIFVVLFSFFEASTPADAGSAPATRVTLSGCDEFMPCLSDAPDCMIVGHDPLQWQAAELA